MSRRKKTLREKRIERIQLLDDIHAGRKHTHRNDILAPLAQMNLIAYDHAPVSLRAKNVRLTEDGEMFLNFWRSELNKK